MRPSTLFMARAMEALESRRSPRRQEIGPRKHCRTCGGEHRARACSMVLVDRIAKSGRTVKRWTRNTLAVEPDAS